MANFCSICKIELIDRQKKYCSRNCRNIGFKNIGEINQFKRGHPSWNKGKKRTWSSPTEFKKGKRYSPLTEFKKGQKAWNNGKNWEEMQGENSVNWKGDDVGLCALHEWVKKHLGEAKKCEYCNIEGRKCSDGRNYIHWANKSHEYRRRLDDWVTLCVKCHSAFDHGYILIE